MALTGHNEDNPLATEPLIPTTTYRLGVPAPDGAPTVAVSGTGNEGAIDITTAYVYTFVTEFGEEGPPSPPSEFVEFEEGQTRTVTLPSLHTGNYAFGSGSLVRV